MDLLLQLQAIVALFALIISYHILVTWTKRNKIKSKEAPEGGRSWPIIGHLHLLRGPEPFHHRLTAMAKKYGPVFTLRLGMHPTLVVTGSEAIKDCFTTSDKALASRPCSAAGEYMCYNNLMFGSAPYGVYWRELRKISILHLLSNSRLEMLKHVRATEIDLRIKELYQRWVENHRRPAKVDMKQWLNDLTFNVVTKMVVGKRFLGDGGEEGEARRFRELIGEFFRLLGVFVVSDAFPFLRWLDWKGHKRTMKRNARELDLIIGKMVEEHRRRRLCNNGECKEEDFMDAMLSIMEDAPLTGVDHDTVIKANSLGFIIAGPDTTGITLAAALYAVVSNPHVLKKAQNELDTHVGKDRPLQESDIKNLVYLQAIIKETLRFSPAGTLLPLHEAMEDCQIGGFHVPAGTRLLVNIGKLHRDPLIWSDPLQFRPERFLTSHIDVDVRGQHFEYMPFGSGRRICPGISFALQVMHLTLGRLLHGFDLEIPLDAPPIDLVESFRMDNPKPPPLEVLFAPRLAPELFAIEM